MSSDDSFMQIVRERLANKGFFESQTKAGLFYRKNQTMGYTMFIDMRSNPMRMYGYEMEGNRQLSDEEIHRELKHIKRMLVSIGVKPLEGYQEEVK